MRGKITKNFGRVGSIRNHEEGDFKFQRLRLDTEAPKHHAYMKPYNRDIEKQNLHKVLKRTCI